MFEMDGEHKIRGNDTKLTKKKEKFSRKRNVEKSVENGLKSRLTFYRRQYGPSIYGNFSCAYDRKRNTP